MNRTNAAFTGTVALALAGGLAFGVQHLGPAAEQRAGDRDLCRVDDSSTLPAEARESSGLARGIAHPDVFWTHNDSGNEPELYGVDGSGRLVMRVRLDGASLVDWEDMEAAPCAAGTCLYVSDTGDNDGDREHVTIYELSEPAPGSDQSTPTAYHGRYPDGRHDAEALFTVDGAFYVVTKGRRGPIRLYRFPLDAGATATLEPIAELAAEPGDAGERVTAATASADGRWVVIRTPAELRFHDAARLLAGDVSAVHRYDLAAVGHQQGESVAMDDAGHVWLTSEAEGENATPAFSRLSCLLD